MHVAGGRMALEFYRASADGKGPGTTLYTLSDAQTGERIMDLSPAKDAGGEFACSTPNGFTFLGGAEGELALLRAVPR